MPSPIRAPHGVTSGPVRAAARTAQKAPSRSGTEFERIPVHIFDAPAQMSAQVANRVRALIEAKQAVGEPVVLGLPTGSTPIGVYHALVEMHREEGLDFSNVVTFNIDEYFPMQADSLQSYHRFMWENFFDHVNISPGNVHIPDGSIPHEDVEAHAAEYERKIAKAGGIDLLLLGIGRSGHIGFNEPGSKPEDRTRLIVLDEITRKDAANDFFEEKHVPREAITMGVGTILDAREIILMATGEHKAAIVQRAVEEAPNAHVSATYLQLHPNAAFYVDRPAASQLTREKTPWLVKHVTWDDFMAKRAVIWLSRKAKTPILQLEAADFHRNHLHELVHAYGDADELCRMVFEDLRQRVLYRQNLPTKKRIIVFSPHPDDDVISMGGMLAKLVQNDNDVTVAYMTNGSVAVFDQDVRRHLRFVEMTYRFLSNGSSGAERTVPPADEETTAAGSPGMLKKIANILEALEQKEPGQVDLEEVQHIKAYIRYSEAINALEVIGLGPENARFLDMPFYKTGRVKKDPIGEADVQIVFDFFREIEPDHIFVAGDLSDPHGTHRMCYKAISEALEQYNEERGADEPEPTKKTNGRSKRHDAKDRRPHVWLYRGAWQEWEIERADVFLPISKSELDVKIEAIFKHESQKDRALFPGAYDEREFWQRARDRNRATARELDDIGLPACYAVEAFVNCYTMP
ncbi:glucosamine-6-phosphate deaminase [soil metagenome]